MQELHTAKTLNTLGTKARVDLFEKLALSIYGTDRFNTILAADLGLTRRAVGNWRNGRSCPPIWAILLVQEWAFEKTSDQILLKAAASMAGDMASVARTLLRASQAFERNLADGSNPTPLPARVSNGRASSYDEDASAAYHQ